MPPHRRGSAGHAARPSRTHTRQGYAALSTRPLHILAFLLPLVVAYELGSAAFLGSASGETVEQIRAQRLLATMFEAMGVSSLYLPGALLVVVLLIWHLLTRDPWRIKWPVLGGMLLESAAWTAPLLVFGQIVGQMTSGAGGAEPLAAAGFGALGWPARATIAVGAGIYEELLFRMVAIAGLHLLLVDVLRVHDAWGRALAVLISAGLFALYHDNQSAWLFYATAGVYFGALYAVRGFGVVVATHAIYDLVALLTVSPAGA